MQINYKDIEAQLSWMCDAMIPGSAELDMPSASKLELITKLLPRALEARPDLAPKFYETVASLPAETPADPLKVINAVPVAQMEIVGRFIAGAYLTASEVTTALRFPGFQALYENVDYDEIMEAIEPIIERGPCYVIV
ncbi:hypothetical protein [Variovorax sp. V116]|uniref:hypothetical protein n=1 Tax=Variovorax sp. V116 TaxID=3065953 RepID=UPI0034E8B3CD